MKRLLIGMLCLLCVHFVAAQSRSITGKVLDFETKEGLPFASIHVPNTLVGTMTNEVGEFELKLKKGRDTIQISYLGYLDELIVVGDEIEFEVFLKPWGIDLKEVIVNPQEPLYYIKRAIENYANTISSSPFETAAYYAQKTSILNDQTDAYQMEEAVFKTYYTDFTLDSLDAQHQAILYRPSSQGEMKTMIERNKKIEKKIKRGDRKYDKRVAKRKRKNPETVEKEDEEKANEAPRNKVSVGGFTGEGPNEILESAQDVINSPFFKSDHFKKFKYTFGEPSFYKSRKLMVIHFKNKRKVEFAIYDGTLYLDYEDLSIVSIKYNERGKIPWYLNTVIKGVAGFKISGLESDVVINNQFLNNYWYPKELRKDFKILMEQEGEVETIIGQQVLNIYNIDITNPVSICKEKIFDSEKKYKDQIFNEQDIGWLDVNVVKL